MRRSYVEGALAVVLACLCHAASSLYVQRSLVAQLIVNHLIGSHEAAWSMLLSWRRGPAPAVPEA